VHERPEESAIAEILERQQTSSARDAANKVRAAVTAAQTLRQSLPRQAAAVEGVKIWSGPSADRPEAAGSSLMPSISESPLEQDFTIEGKPSRLGCPFASMTGKKLSSHAASVLSRYNTRESAGGGGAPTSSALSSVSRVNGKESLSRRESRRASFADPIKAEICGLSDHNEQHQPANDAQPSLPTELVAPVDVQHHVSDPENAEVGVCPIRFIDQHSPEEVATYFEKHKHELPRSHEVCVRRYQSNEESIRQLDAKYGNIVSMIQGLGKKHKDYLPADLHLEEGDEEAAMEDAKSNEKVRRWASNVSARAVDGRDDVVEVDVDEGDGVEEEERQPHFERPLRDVRVGESPSRPWGIQVPVKYLEKHAGEATSEVSTRPAQISAPLSPAPPERTRQEDGEAGLPTRFTAAAKRAGCPFAALGGQRPSGHPPPVAAKVVDSVDEEKLALAQQPAFINPEAQPCSKLPTGEEGVAAAAAVKEQSPRMVFTGPVFIGYSAEDAAKILRESGLGGGGGGARS